MAGLAERLSAAAGPVPMPDGWNSSAVFAHLAFWDRLVLARWDGYARAGTIGSLPDGLQDLINAAALPLWLALDPLAAIAEGMDAATAVVERIAGLDQGAVVAARSAGLTRMLDRTPHWTPHLDEVEAALAGA